MTGPWRKSSRSGGGTGSQCVETRHNLGEFQVRDSKLGDASPILDIPGTEFSALLADLKAGRLDN
ncbi:DUF397 domain-containing protein [Stackebrandtia nassauensis]|uniref:DUF397 domain-containing protein n=1 Tax=Stackebrandtia nassauensis (strain DSM 44728 / CIP 108903 / NRRL B-16338 / NBRC 102104 / LLR-40K-21) TaxID=446470 RepID=D3Q8V5_STANL|nr:DUF397 domain-containing protein [Stackebrandtia nassauensis]ADD44547.1 hypothetical protein Snas_4906 [Stackebrandtia nassauensis DSM 44728]